MAEIKNERSGRAEQPLTRQDRERGSVQRWSPSARLSASPFELMDRMTEEMDRMFERVFGGSSWPGQRLFSRGSFGRTAQQGFWAPRVEAFQKGDRLIIRAELPGLRKDDVQVELSEDAVTIHGERREEREEEREGYFHSEREYGQFHRVVPLPEGVIAESAEASFRDGVLEVNMQAPPSEARRGRRLEIKEAGSRK